MSPTYPLLSIISRRPSYGYDIKKEYDKLFAGEKQLAFGQVYATLSRLLRDKKITTEAIEQAGGPERKRYAITTLGREDLESWVIAPEKLHPGAQTIMFIKVVSAILLDKQADIFLDAQRASHISRMRELTALRRGGDLSQVLQADYALFHLEADLRWIDSTAARLQTLTKEIRSEQ